MFSILILINCVSFYRTQTFIRSENEKLVKFLKDNSDNTLGIFTFGISNMDVALTFSSLYAGKMQETYFEKITSNRPEFLYYDVWNSLLKSWWSPKNYNDVERIRKNLTSGKKLLFVKRGGIAPFDPNDSLIKILKVQYGFNNPQLKEVFSNGSSEKAYELILK
ncbi:MAG: hypothetical protein ABI462_01180 [Ignavibacteria bacterium]